MTPRVALRDHRATLASFRKSTGVNTRGDHGKHRRHWLRFAKRRGRQRKTRPTWLRFAKTGASTRGTRTAKPRERSKKPPESCQARRLETSSRAKNVGFVFSKGPSICNGAPSECVERRLIAVFQSVMTPWLNLFHASTVDCRTHPEIEAKKALRIAGERRGPEKREKSANRSSTSSLSMIGPGAAKNLGGGAGHEDGRGVVGPVKFQIAAGKVGEDGS